MVYKVLGDCPVCGENLRIVTLKCPACSTEIKGDFISGKFAQLSENQLKFVEIFLKSRGNIKEVEKEMGISYPTVRNKLDEVISVLGYNVESTPDDMTGEKRKEILIMLENGDIDSSEAVKMLKNL